MTVEFHGDATIALVGACPIEEAEPLLRHLLDRPHATVDWRGCDSAHAAIIQVVMASGAKLIGPPRDIFLARFVAPVIAENATSERHLPSELHGAQEAGIIRYRMKARPEANGL